jgi:hypothetical protein
MPSEPGEGIPEPSLSTRVRRREPHAPLAETRFRRAAYALVFLALVLIVGTVGFHLVAGLAWVDSFYFESMLATGQGPPLALTSDASKLYASAMAFVSVGSVLTTVVFTLGPIAARAWREAAQQLELDARQLEDEIFPGRR